MHSSISDSSALRAGRAFVLLLAALLGYFLTLEIAMRAVVPRISAMERRQRDDFRSVLTLRPTTAAGAESVLVVGNSLLLEGIDRDRLQHLMGSQYQVALLPIENTTYLDWYFALRRLFTEGARPANIVLCMSAAQMLSDATDQDRFAYSMMRLGDTLEVARAAHLNATTTTDYFFANLSAWLGLRAGLRNAVLHKWLPDANELADTLVLRPSSPVTLGPRDALRILTRLEAIRNLARARGAELLFLAPPLLTQDNVWPSVQASAARLGISVLVPLRSAEVSSLDFSDGFHLNATGAALFTDRVAPELRASLETMRR